MFGRYDHNVDPKGRLFVPAKLRPELGEAFYVTLGLDSCLSFYTEASWQRIMDRFNSLPLAQSTRMRHFIGSTVRCEPDKQGRFLLPAELRKFASIGQEVTFIGLGDHGEIWNTEAYRRVEEEAVKPENLRAVLEELNF